MIVDFHTHSFPDKIAASAIEKLSSTAHIKAFADGTANGILKSMSESNVDLSIMLPVAVKASNVENMNTYSAQFNTLYADKGIFSFGCMHPDYDNWKNELKRVAQLGLKGIKIHPVYQGVKQDDIRYVRILERAGELGLIVAAHAGLDIGFPGVVNSTPAMIVNALKQAGPVKFIAAHMGSWKLWDDIEPLVSFPDVYIDTAFSLGSVVPRGNDSYYLENDNSLLDNRQFCSIVHKFGADRVLFGSDNPWDSQKDAVCKVKNSGLSCEELDKILCTNACSLLKRNTF
ncbi:MAG: metal-dependent hydrolase [Ruminococcaceae bacterium]|nr:metal-dependent hydrolase [Oscillospiraceae bacterium]